MSINDLFTEKQQEYLRTVSTEFHRWNFKEGAVRSGKTYLDTTILIPYRILTAPIEGLIFLIGNTRGSLEQNILTPLREQYGKGLVSQINHTSGKARLFGREVFALGADKVSTVKRIHGSTVSYCYGDEVTTWNEDVFSELKSRLSVEGACFDGTLNPESPNHWLLKFLESDVDIYRQHYLLSDNKKFLPESYYEQIQKEYAGTVFYNRYILGEWTRAEGLIYQNFNPKTDALEEVPEELTGRRYVSCDYGTQNPCVYLMWEEGKSGTWYLTKEYYYSGKETGRQKTDREYVIDYFEFVSDKPSKSSIIDPSAASFIAALREKGVKVRKAKNDVLDGIRYTATCLQTGKIKILKCCTRTLEEIGAYSWDKNRDDAPLKEKDHAMDAMRYFCYTVLKNEKKNTKQGIRFLR